MKEENIMENPITAIIVEPDKPARVARIANDLKTLQTIVGGYIEVIRIDSNPVVIVCNDSGKITELPPNRCLRMKKPSRGYYEYVDIIYGTFLVVGVCEPEFVSVPEELIDQYLEMFRGPEELDEEYAVVKEDGRCD
jgi:hypothetical protein